MKRIIFVIISSALLVMSNFNAQNFKDFIFRLNSMKIPDHQTVVDSFMKSNCHFPTIEDDTLVHFIYQEDLQKVTVIGDYGAWKENYASMTNIS